MSTHTWTHSVIMTAQPLAMAHNIVSSGLGSNNLFTRIIYTWPLLDKHLVEILNTNFYLQLLATNFD